ncbi:MAG: T9SS type A sorting domain-containing protein [Bacteroidales bacterium]|nr:T9SS type A sorting domain-containing protein [Bacteroidales bacterium]
MQTNLLKLSFIAFCVTIFISSTAQQNVNLRHSDSPQTTITKNNAPKGWHKSIDEVLFYEDFSAGLDAWTVQGVGLENWGIVQTNKAGGAIPEVMMNWSPSFLGTTRLVSPVINTSGFTQLSLSFLHFLDPYAFNTGFWVSVETTSDGGATWNQVWELNWLTGDNYNAFEVLILNAPDIGSANFQFSFKFEDDSYQIDAWNIDNVTLGEQASFDVTPISISGFENLIHEGDVVNISSEIVNYGSEIVSFDVIFEIYEGSDIVFSSTKSVSNLAFGEPATVAFDPWNAVKGFYRASVTTLLSGDENPDNDQNEHFFPVVDANWYCAPAGDCFSAGGFITGITDFAFAGIENYNSGCSDNGYGVFTNLQGTAEIGSDYVASVAVGFQSQFVSIWIDLNQDIEFTPDELVVTDFEMTDDSIFYEIPITIPGNGLPGATVVRVGSCFLQPSSPDPCANLWAGEWEDYTLILTGSPINLNAGVVSIDMEPFILQGNVLPKATVKNYGIQTVSFPVTCTINESGYSSTMNVTDLALNEEVQVLFDQWPAEPGTYDVEIISELPGDEVPVNDMLNTTVGIVESIPTKMVVGEEGTGTWCGWCVAGIVFMDSMQMKYPDTWIGIAVHNGDPMVVEEYDANFSPLINYSYPMALADRAILVDPSNLEAAYMERMNKISPAAIAIENKSFNSSTGELSFTLTSEFVARVSDYRFNAALIENNVTGTGPGWSQANYYSGGMFGPMGGFELLPDPVPAEDMVYQAVARAILGGFEGTEGSLPETVYAGEIHSFDFSITIPEDWNIENLEIVGMLIDHNAGTIVNGAKEELITGIADIASTTNICIFPNPATNELRFSNIANGKIFIYDINGRLIMEKQNVGSSGTLDISSIENGIYIVKVILDNKAYTTKLNIIK